MKKTMVKILVSASVLAVLFVLLPWHEMKTAWDQLEWTVWLTCLVALSSTHLVGAWKWALILRVGRARLRATQAISAYNAGLFANLCLPSIVGGDALRAVIATRITRRGEAVLLGGLADRLIDVLGLGLLALAGAWCARTGYDGWVRQLLTLGLIVGGIGGVLGLMLVLRLPIQRWPPKVQRILRRSLVALRRLVRRPQAALAALLASIAMQTCFVLLNAWIGRSIGIDAPLSVWFFAWPLAKIAGLMPVSLAGIGVRDAALAALLVPAGVPYATGFMASLIWQTEMVGLGLLGGAIWQLTRRLGPPLPARRPGRPDPEDSKQPEGQYV